MAERAWIKNLKPGTELDEVFVVRSRELRRRRGGGNYLAVTLGDRTGEVASLAWENGETLAKVCEPGAIVRIGGHVQQYQGRTQVVFRRAETVDQSDIDPSLFVRSSMVDADVLWQKLQSLIGAMEDVHLRQLLFRIFSDPEVETSFRLSPAAKTMHHAFRSGLLEHSVSAAGAGAVLADHYQLHKDLVVAGILLHDLGKIWELETENSIEYTDDGRLIGHLALETLYVDKVIGELEDFPAEMRRQLLHILLSHHGEYAYGSPRRPKTPEAMLVHTVDNLDARLACMFEAIDQDGDSDQAWSGFSRMLERNVYRRRP
jgi:3'-5' exoribonuclease